LAQETLADEVRSAEDRDRRENAPAQPVGQNIQDHRRNQPPSPPPAKRSFWTRTPVILIGALLLGIGAFFGISHLAYSAAHESTDDAFIEAHVASLAPKVSGIATAVLFTDNQWVTNGELLVEIDPRDYETRAAQKRASVESAEANRKTYLASYELVRTRVETARASAAQTRAEAEAAKATADRAASDFQRAQQLRQQNVASAAEFDVARAAAENARASFVAAQAKAAADQSRVAEAEAQMEAARNLLATASAQKSLAAAELESAQLDVSYTKIFAPSSGRVARRAVEVGTYLQIGQRICALVPSNVWVVANFKETQLARMRVGQPAVLHLDAFPDRAYRGHVESVQAGSGARFSLLPPENAVGNYVKVVQRVPAKIVFDEPLLTPNAVGPGMSVMPTVEVSTHQLSKAVIVLLAAGISIVIAALWWILARRKQS